VLFIEQARAASQQAGIAIGAQPTSTDVRTAPVVAGAHFFLSCSVAVVFLWHGDWCMRLFACTALWVG
jgi:hypothetical protein